MTKKSIPTHSEYLLPVNIKIASYSLSFLPRLNIHVFFINILTLYFGV